MAKAAMSINDIQELAFTIFGALPNKLTKENISDFAEACNKVSALCSDPKLYRLLIPFHHLTFRWQSAYGEGFTWQKFLEDIIADGCTSVECTKGQFGPGLWFSNGSREEFGISMVHDD